MPNGRGTGRGFFRRGFVPWGVAGYGYGAYPAYGYPYLCGGRGNPFPFCRNFPWLPRRWWAIPGYGYPQPWAPAAPSQELDLLRSQAEFLEGQFKTIRARVEELERSQQQKG